MIQKMGWILVLEKGLRNAFAMPERQVCINLRSLINSFCPDPPR